MILDGAKFRTSLASRFVDLGTLADYKRYCMNRLTIFCDVDGVLCENGSKFAEKGWDTDCLVKEPLNKPPNLPDLS